MEKTTEERLDRIEEEIGISDNDTEVKPVEPLTAGQFIVGTIKVVGVLTAGALVLATGAGVVEEAGERVYKGAKKWTKIGFDKAKEKIEKKLAKKTKDETIIDNEKVIKMERKEEE